MLTATQTKWLKALADAEDCGDDYAAEIVCSGIECYIGHDKTSWRTVNALLSCTAISKDAYGGGCEHFTINSTGRAILRRPELADEVFEAMVRGGGSWTIRDDRLVPLHDQNGASNSIPGS